MLGDVDLGHIFTQLRTKIQTLTKPESVAVGLHPIAETRGILYDLNVGSTKDPFTTHNSTQEYRMKKQIRISNETKAKSLAFTASVVGIGIITVFTAGCNSTKSDNLSSTPQQQSTNSLMGPRGATGPAGPAGPQG
ncbi:MAG: hypothetical protein PF795_09795, partial [Kiritimatiellae bacterium]|nr:hypothetical protein [Kiritimatiellia bacterium]